MKHLQSATDIDPVDEVDELDGHTLQGSGDENSLYFPNGHAAKLQNNGSYLHEIQVYQLSSSLTNSNAGII